MLLALAAPALGEFENLEEGFHLDPDGSTVSAGFSHTCALRYEESAQFGGSLACWGFNGQGQTQPPVGTFIQLSAGHMHSCGVRIDETIACWGSKINNVHNIPKGLWQQVSAGDFHTCGLQKAGAGGGGGTISCWGMDGDSGCTKAPPGRFVQVSAGNLHTCGLRPNGQVTCWGNNKHGQSATPKTEQFKQISASMHSHHTCGITLKRADLVCWGDNSHMQSENRDGPFDMVATGHKSTCAIRSVDKQIECWGIVNRIREARDMGKRWEQLTVGWNYACAIDDDAELHCFGPHVPNPANNPSAIPDDFVVA